MSGALPMIMGNIHHHIVDPRHRAPLEQRHFASAKRLYRSGRIDGDGFSTALLIREVMGKNYAEGASQPPKPCLSLAMGRSEGNERDSRSNGLPVWPLKVTHSS